MSYLRNLKCILIKCSNRQWMKKKEKVTRSCIPFCEHSHIISKRRFSNTASLDSTFESMSREYGTKLTVRRSSKPPFAANHPLSDFVFTNLKSSDADSVPVQASTHSDMCITFLGTGAGGRANHKRAPTATALRVGGRFFLFDGGEGTQRQIAFSNLNFLDLDKIFVTHMHADHVMGLIGIILQLDVSMKNSVVEGNQFSRTLQIFGPKGIYNFICLNLTLTHSRVKNLKIIVNELSDDDTGASDTSPIKSRKVQRHKTNHTNDHTQHYSDLKRSFHNIQLNTIYSNDGIWTLQETPTMQRGATTGRNSYDMVTIQAAKVYHLPQVQTFGYVIYEPDPLPKINIEKAKALGVNPGPKYRDLKNGFSVRSDDDLKEVYPYEVTENVTSKGRKVAIIGDTYQLTKEMKKLCENANVLVYEATLDVGSESLRTIRGHSTAQMAGRLASEVDARVLLLNHISMKNDGMDDVESLVQSAMKGMRSRVIVGVTYDFMSMNIP